MNARTYMQRLAYLEECIRKGRLVLDTRAHSASGRSEGITLQGEGAALYMVVVDRFQAVKLAAIR